jgi:hypothetical protein
MNKMDNEQVLPYNTIMKNDWLLKANNQIVPKTLFFLDRTTNSFFFKIKMDSVMTMEHGQMLASTQINSEPSEDM